MKITIGNEKTMTLEELAREMCKKIGQVECVENECPGFDYCYKNHNGLLAWFREVLER